MQLLLMRHGEAKPVGVDGISIDADRVLSDAGKTKVMEAAEGLMECGITRLDKVYSSPLKRALETAEIVAEVFNFSGEIISTQALEPGFDQKEVIELLKHHSPDDKILVVAHQPDLGKLASRFLGGSPDEGMKLKAGDICALSTPSIPPDEKAAELDFLVTSKDQFCV